MLQRCEHCGTDFDPSATNSGSHFAPLCIERLERRVMDAEREADAMRRQLRRLHENVEAGVFVNATPDAEYPIRILEGHLGPNESTFVTDNLAGFEPTDPVLVEMNKASKERAEILRAAIANLRAITNPATR